VLRRSTFYVVLGGWLLLAAIRFVPSYPESGAWNWILGILYLVFTLALVALLIAHAVAYARRRAEIKRSGGRFFTARFVKWFLVVGWLLSALYRLATIYDLPNAASGAPLWLFSVGLLGYFVYWLTHRSRSDPGRQGNTPGTT
jgi:uncharacterized membrane protein YhaH (DUF805 family)